MSPETKLHELADSLRRLSEEERAQLVRIALRPQDRVAGEDEFRRVADRILKEDRETLDQIGDD
jgi:hypothetical protein